MRKKKPKWMEEKPLVTHDENGKLTRAGAVLLAREKWGDMGTISSDEQPLMVWCIGRMEETVGKGKTWEEALERSKP